ncbi:MAG: membrane integrity-associated transporter subunit PqiC [Proteobacteria bacterium]|nr:membrane integrity-associated transporter subunit PqiC [Pseudomonadota bacterium]
MSPSKTPLTALVLTGAAVMLSACVSLFPKAEPAQLYRFGPQAEAGADLSTAPGRVNVTLAQIEFTPASAGDRLLTMNGAEAAYISGARWVSPAQDLFEASVRNAFAASPQVRLVEPRRAMTSNLVLDLKVDNFEARYDAGPKAAPTAVVTVHARMIRYPDRTVVGDHMFRATQTAGDNRVGAIVPAYDAAVGAVLKELTPWTEQIAAKNAGR